MEISTGRFAVEAAAVVAFRGKSSEALTRAELDAFVGAASAVFKQAQVLVAVGAAEVRRRDEADRDAEGGSRRRGHASSRRRVAEQTGGSEAEAQKLIDVGEALNNAERTDEGPDPDEEAPRAWLLVAAAVLDGRLSADQAEVIIRGLEAAGDRAKPGLEEELVAMGLRLSLRDLRRAVDGMVAALDREHLAAKQRAQHEEREIRIWEGRDGATHIRGVLDPVTAAPFKAFLDAYVRAAYAAKRDAASGAPPDTRTTAQMHADAVRTLATHVLGCREAAIRGSATVVVRADRKELAAELGVGGCDQVHTPISGHQLRLMACGAGLMPVLTDGESLPVDYGRVKEFFTLEQRLAMLERDGGCALCHAPPSWCEAHHVIERQRGGPTSLTNGAMLCTRCHHDVHRDHWQITLRRVTDPDGIPEDQIWFTPPAKVDPERKPRLGGRAALRITNVELDPLPEAEPAAELRSGCPAP